MGDIDFPALPSQAFINGAYQEASSGELFVTRNPATGHVLTEVAACDETDTDRAVISARRAFESGEWSGISPRDRKQVLLSFASLLEDHVEELALLDALDAGKPITDCREIDLPETITTFRWYAEVADKLFDSVAPTGLKTLGLILREPVGVVGAVLPWNFPALMAAMKVAPALAAGSSIVVKPAEQTPLSTLRLADLACQAGLPSGVFNVIPGLGEVTGQALGRHTGVDVVTFTGSTEIGRRFLQYSAESNLKQIVLECGGKSPQIVLADAPDLDKVADDLLDAAFWNMGENCTCGSRVLVHKSIKDELLERMVNRTAEWRVGDPLDPSTKIGPMIEQDHLAKVLGYIDSGRSDNATVVVGGGRLLEETGGYYVAPTVFDNVTNDMRIAREEIFGPVVAAIAFDTVDEAVAIANDTNYGLAASVWTENLDLALSVARAIRAGTVSVNCYSEGDITTPFGGYKESGFGGRDKGIEAIHQYTELKTVWIESR